VVGAGCGFGDDGFDVGFGPVAVVGVAVGPIGVEVAVGGVPVIVVDVAVGDAGDVVPGVPGVDVGGGSGVVPMSVST
jgi:hypothetical protein